MGVFSLVVLGVCMQKEGGDWGSGVRLGVFGWYIVQEILSSCSTAIVFSAHVAGGISTFRGFHV